MKLISDSVAETEQIGKRVARALKGTEVIALFGGLGMGKTAFTRGLAAELGAKAKTGMSPEKSCPMKARVI